jgi:fatty acid desaturase
MASVNSTEAKHEILDKPGKMHKGQLFMITCFAIMNLLLFPLWLFFGFTLITIVLIWFIVVGIWLNRHVI